MAPVEGGDAPDGGASRAPGRDLTGERSAPYTVLAFDFGLKRIGLASGDTLTSSASPRPAVAVSHSGPDWVAIERELRSLHPRILVVGAPYNVDGTPGAVAPAARRFAAELEKRFGLPVNRVDERFSSLEANEALKARRASGERRKRIRREDIDSAAAAVILERWFAGEGRLK
ncbi:MAG TPA: Holliday junction resolvase RuvX [Steroidobacteraceae bacterium]|nr:Holliday junction resolvase RuvX [Steroidobacteraceae bacterium]